MDLIKRYSGPTLVGVILRFLIGVGPGLRVLYYMFSCQLYIVRLSDNCWPHVASLLFGLSN